MLCWCSSVISISTKTLRSHLLCLLQTVECIPGLLFQDFMRILTQLRSEHGLPLNVVLLSPPGRSRQLEMDSFSFGILARDFELPASKILYGASKGYSLRSLCCRWLHNVTSRRFHFSIESIWERVFIQDPLPVTLDPRVLQLLRDSFDHHHSSAVRAAQMLKQALAHSCTPRGENVVK